MKHNSENIEFTQTAFGRRQIVKTFLGLLLGLHLVGLAAAVHAVDVSFWGTGVRVWGTSLLSG